ncbi:MAG: hypothetical protein Tsb0027_02330 [Wenzhouxiangellaceae bacterium]
MLNQEVARLELEQKRAEALQAIAEANQAALAANLPSTEATGKEGGVTVDNKAGYYAELMAYSTLTDSAQVIGDHLAEHTNNKTVVVTDQTDLDQQAALWEVIRLRAESFQDEFDKIINDFSENGTAKQNVELESIGVVAATLTSLLGAASDIMAFFKVDRELKGRETTLSKRALVAEVARHLCSNTNKILLPDLALAGDRALLTQLNGARDGRKEIATRLQGALKLVESATKDRDGAKAEWEKLKNDKAPAEQIARAKKALDAENTKLTQLNQRVTRFETVITAFDAFFTAVSTASTPGAKSPLETVAVVDLVRSHEDTLLLYLDIPSGGAEIHITDSVWSSGRLSYIGGSVAVFFLVDQKGKVLAAGSLPRSKAASFKVKKVSDNSLSLDPERITCPAQ